MTAYGNARWLAGLGAALCALAAVGPVAGAEHLRVEKLLEQGWEVAGYVTIAENRTLILLKHKEHRYLVQCSVLVDVMRSPRVVTACYEIR